MGLIKVCIYGTKLQNVQELKDAMIAEIQSLSVKLFLRLCQLVSGILEVCKDLEEKHIKTIFVKSFVVQIFGKDVSLCLCYKFGNIPIFFIN